jgi:hypothetical protein
MARTGYLHSLALRAGGQTPAAAERGQTLRLTNALLRRWELLAKGADDGGVQSPARAVSRGQGPAPAPASGLTQSPSPTWERGPAAFSPLTNPAGVAVTSGPQMPRPAGTASAGDPSMGQDESVFQAGPRPAQLAGGAAPGGDLSRASAEAGPRVGAGTERSESRAGVAPQPGAVRVEVGRVVRGDPSGMEPGRPPRTFATEESRAPDEARGEGPSGMLRPARSRNLDLASDGNPDQAGQAGRARGRDAGETEAVPHQGFRPEPGDIDAERGARTQAPLTPGTVWPWPPDRSARPEPATDAGPTVQIGTIEIIVTAPTNDTNMLGRAPGPAPTLQTAPRAPTSRPGAAGRLARGYLSGFGLRQG